MDELVDSQKELESNFEQNRSSKGTAGGDSIHVSLNKSTQSFARAVKQSPLTADNVEKMQADRCVIFVVKICWQFQSLQLL